MQDNVDLNSVRRRICLIVSTTAKKRSTSIHKLHALPDPPSPGSQAVAALARRVYLDLLRREFAAQGAFPRVQFHTIDTVSAEVFGY